MTLLQKWEGASKLSHAAYWWKDFAACSLLEKCTGVVACSPPLGYVYTTPLLLLLPFCKLIMILYLRSRKDNDSKFL